MSNAFYSGSAASFADVKNAIETALVSEGWTLSSGVLNNGVGYFKLTAAVDHIDLQAGTGQAGAALTGSSPSGVRVASLELVDPIVFPVVYELSINEDPDEVYCVINHGVDRYQNLSFGVSPAPGNDSGIWINGTGGSTAIYSSETTGFFYGGDNAAPSPNIGNNHDYVGAGLLATQTPADVGYASHYVHDSEGWPPEASYPTETGSYAGCTYVYQLLSCLPSAANQSLVLLPIYALKMADSNGAVITASLRHARFCRIDNEAPGAVVSYGSERWKVYPNYRKNTAQRSPDLAPGRYLHSGTYGFAVRYHGP